jgi:hypothetical protein
MSENRSRFRPAGGRAGDGEIETTRTETTLAVVLAVFIAIGAIWGYFKLDEVGEQANLAYRPDRALIGPGQVGAIRNHQEAIRSVQVARVDRRKDVRELELSREAYRTALDAGGPSTELQTEYESAQAGVNAATRDVSAAVAVEKRTRPAANEAQGQLMELRRDAAARADDDRAHHDRIVFLLRIGLLALMLGGAYWLLSRLRSRSSRYLPAALAGIGATAVLAAVMAVDYTDGYVEFSEVGPLAVSIVGIAFTLVAFIALQRFLVKRIPARRVRRGECPFCGFPLRGEPHCEGCGRGVIASCASCENDRRVGTPRCGFCGNP